MSQQANHLYEFGAYCLNCRDRLLLLKGEVVPLTPKAIETLLILVQNAGHVVSKDELMSAVWPDTFVEEGGLTRNIYVLRKALGDADNGPRYIETIPKRGYRFVAGVTERPALGEYGKSVVPAQRPPRPTVGQSTTEAVDIKQAAPASPQEARRERAEQRSFNSTRARARMWAVLAFSVALIAGVVSLLRVILPLPVPQVLRTVQITTFGRVEAGHRLVISGRTIFFEEGRGASFNPMQVSSDGGEPVPVPTPFHSASILAASPDASQLLLASFEGVENDHPLWLLPAVGGSPKRLADLDGHDGTWFPGGNRILYAHGNDLFVANADGSDPRKLLSAPGRPSWPHFSPDGETLRFTVAGPPDVLYSLWQASADSSHLRPLLPGWKLPPKFWGEGDCCGSWTPDGKYYLFRSVRDNSASLWAIREKGDFLHAANHQPVKIYVSHTGLGNPVLGPDGKRLFVVNGRISFELARYDTESHRFVPFLSGIPARWLAFSQDGRWVAYVDGADGSLWRSAADGSQRLRLTSSPPAAVYPRWSPDGKRILFHLVNPGVRRKLYVIPSEGGKAEMLVPGSSEEEQADWFPDGNSLLFDRDSPTTGKGTASRDICILNLTTRQVSVLRGSQGLKFTTLCPRGRYATAVTEDARKLMLYDFRARRWAELATGHGIIHAFWTRDSQYVYYQDEYGGPDQPIIRVRIADHKTERVTGPGSDLPMDVEDILLIGISPDGSPLVSLQRSNSDIYALDLDLP
jgi:DNA-binding winged helix-turn-helix (wHTH) protein/Tol biopolymer transport system component